MKKLLLLILLLLSYDARAEISGFIVDSLTGEPIEYALVKPAGLSIHSLTNAKGFFKIEFSHFNYLELIVTHSDYNTKKVIIREIDLHNIYIKLSKTGSITNEIEISANRESIITPSQILSGVELEKNKTVTLAETISDLAGISIRSMGAATARPVLRGLSSYRLIIANDGMPINDLSATSPDHAVTLSTQNIETIDVYTGPDLVMFSSSLAGGVINSESFCQSISQPPNFSIVLNPSYESANKSKIFAGSVNVPYHKFSVNSSINYINSEDISSPDGILNNTYSNLTDADFGASYFGTNMKMQISGNIINSDYGIPGGFVGAHPNGVDIEMHQNNALIDITYLTHGFLNNAGLKLKRSYYNHKEYESSGIVGAEFVVREYAAKFTAEHNSNYIFDNGNFGMDISFREHRYGGYVFTSPADEFSISPYWVFTKTYGKLFTKSGIRFENKIYYPSTEYLSNVGYIRSRSFPILSASIELKYNFSKEFSIKSVISHSERAPAIDELFKEGPHLAAYSFETGNPDLKSENGMVYEIAAEYLADRFNVKSNFYIYDFRSYITPRNTGDTNWATLLPIYTTSEVPAIIGGFDISILYNFNRNFSAYTNFNYIYGEIKNENSPLPMMPPLNAMLSINYKYHNYDFTFHGKYSEAQFRVDRFEQTTPSYMIFGFDASYHFDLYGKYNSIILSADNIFNSQYYNHLSRIKSIFPERGFNLKLSYKLLI